MKRRTFIQRLAATGIVLPVTLGFPRLRAFAKAPAGSSPFARLLSANNDNVMVLIRLAGGNDGLNTVIPYTDSNYYSARTEGSISIAANQVVKLPDSTTMGLHPSLAPLLALYNEKKMTIVQNVAYPNQNLSHFRSTDIWLSGSDSNVYMNSGWYGRYLETKYPNYPAVLPKDPFAIELGTTLGTTCVGDDNNMGVAVGDLSYIPGQPDSDPVAATHAGEEEDYIRTILQQSNVFSNSIIAAYAKVTANKVTYPTGNTLATSMAAIARLIAGGLATQMYIINVGGYDTHSNQLADQATLHANFAAAVLAFQRDMEGFGLDKRVCMMTISEFGRRPQSNGSGTDHGSAAPQFVFGTGVLGGIIGNNPDLTQLDSNKNLKMQYDFRQIYASVLGQWYGAQESELQPKALPRHFDQLPIFKVNQSGVSASDYAAEATMKLGRNYPNPVASTTTIPFEGIPGGMDALLSVNTLDGRQVLKQRVMPGQRSVTLDLSGLPSGSYMYVLRAGSAQRTEHMVVQR